MSAELPDSQPPRNNGSVARAQIEMWGGVECSIARIGERWRSQIDEAGLSFDEAQLQAVAGLGLRRVRFPVLWESVCPQAIDRCDWQWHDRTLVRLRDLGARPIAGLLHHGSGPRYTHLLDPRFPELLARYAAQVAERYPWLDAYTPINEPLTTARFSALYGHWYPHARDTASFLRALVHQCRATVLAMQAIRRINPRALLIHTEDLGKTFAAPALQYQADYENERRWLSYDLLIGRVDRQHPFHATFLAHGIGAAELDFFVQAPCPPDILGANIYLTSERYLDPAVAAYPAAYSGGNGCTAYADVDAVRVRHCAGDVGPRARLMELWQRYRRPIAVTEAHHGCSRDEQVRWLIEVWGAAHAAQASGADIRAVTAWSLFGATDWNSLLVRSEGHYEPGAFDARSAPPRATLLAKAIRTLACRAPFDHPVLDTPAGWWRRETRFYDCAGRPTPQAAAAPVSTTFGSPVPSATRAFSSARVPPRRLLISGATGTLGRAFARICAVRGLEHVLLSRSEFDIADDASVHAAIAAHRPWAVINAAGFVHVDDAERDAGRCFRENVIGPARLAAACAGQALPLVTFSSDQVFDGAIGRPYVESDATSPQGAYGSSKVEAEQRTLDLYPDALVIRSSAFFGPWDHQNFVYAASARLLAGHTFEATHDLVVSPTYVPDLVHATLDLLLDGERGVWHLANRGALSWYELACCAAQHLKVSSQRVTRRPHPTPRSTALTSERGLLMPEIDSALGRFFSESQIRVAASAHAGLSRRTHRGAGVRAG